MKIQWERWSPLAGVLAVVGMVVGFGFGSNSPDTNDSDAKISAYFQAHHTRQEIAFLVFLAGVVFLLLFYSTLRARIADAEGLTARLGPLAWGSGVASAALWVVAVALFTGPAFAVDDTSKFTLDPNTYRLVSDTGYLFWIAAVVVGAIAVWAASAAALRTGLLPRWFAWLGVVVGIAQLFALFFFPVFLYWGWILVTGALLWWRSRRGGGVAVPAA
jgi:hypothetical protein